MYGWPFQPLLPGGATLLSGGGGTATVTYTATLSLDALLLRSDITKTASLDGLLVGTETPVASLDGLLQGTETPGASLDGLVTLTGSKSASLDGLLFQSGELKTTSLDGLLEQTGELKTTSLDGHLEGSSSSRTTTTSLNAVLQRATAVLYDIGAWEFQSQSPDIWADMDAVLVGSRPTTSLDAVLRRNVELDAALQATFTLKRYLTDEDGEEIVDDNGNPIVTGENGSPSLDAWLYKTQTKTASFDAIVPVQDTAVASLTALLEKTGVAKTANFDGLLVSQGSPTTSLDGYLEQNATTFTLGGDALDALLFKSANAKTTSLDATLDTTAPNTLTLGFDAAPLALGYETISYSAGASLDAILGERHLSLAADFDAYLFEWSAAGTATAATWSSRDSGRGFWVNKAQATRGFWDAGSTAITPTTPDAAITGVPSVSLSALLEGTYPLTADVDSIITIGGSRPTSLDGVIATGTSRATTFSADAEIYINPTPTVSLDGFITGKTTFTKSVNLDGIVASGAPTMQVVGLNAVLHPAPVVFIDGRLVRNFGSTTSVQTTNPLDAHLQRTIEKTVQLHGILYETQTKQTNLGAVLKKTTPATISLNSSLKVSMCGGASLDAVITAVGTVTKTLSLNSALNGTKTRTTSMDAVLISTPGSGSEFSTAFSNSF